MRFPLSPSSISRSGTRLLLAIAIPFVALGVQWLLWDTFKPYVWFLFFPAVFFSAWIGGLAGGLAATLISALLVWYFFIPPIFSFAMENLSAAYSMLVFVFMGSLFAWFHEHLRQTMRRTDEALATTEAANSRITQLYKQTLELDALKSQFFANVSHELRTPLTLILAPLESRLRRLSGSDVHAAERRETELMLRNAHLLYRHVSDLLDAAKLESGRMSLVWSRLDVARLTRAMASHFESLAGERHIAYTLDIPDTLPAAADSEKLQRVLLNLLSNAFKFTPDGGAIDVRLTQQDEHLLIEVQDNGPGVPAELRVAVFERFRQVEGDTLRRYGGTGLGLAIVKDFVELHGGTVSLRESPGGGALFSVRLPLAAPAGTTLGAALVLDEVLANQAVEELAVRAPGAAQEDAAGPSPVPSGAVPRVLVVEDNVDMNEFIAATLRPHYRVSTAFNGREGVGKALTLLPDLIVSDLMMPVLSGEEMVYELRRQPATRDMPIVMLTAKADEATRLRLLQDGVQDYLSKPFSTVELLARVSGLLATRQRTMEELRLSAARLRRLAEVVEQIAGVRELPALLAIVCGAVRELSGADGVALVLRDGAQAHYVEEDAIAPLWKGQRFPLESCMAGWVMLHAEAVAIGDIYVDPRVSYAVYRPTFVKSLALVPVGRSSPVGAIGCYWARRHQASGEELDLQQALADALSVGLANLDLMQGMASAQQASEHSAAVARASEAALIEAQGLSMVGNWTWDLLSGRHVWSAEIYRIYGRDPALPPAIYPEVQRYFTADSWARLAAAVEDGRARGTPYSCDAEVVRADGTRRWITARGKATCDAGGKVVELHGTVQDISERKLAEAEIHHLNADLERRVELRTAELSAANHELDSFAYAVSHDLRAPLRAMSGFSQALQEDYGARLDGEAKIYLEQIDIASHKMGELIEGVLALSRSTRGELQHDRIDLSALAARLLADLAHAESSRAVSIEIEPGLAVEGDARMIEVLMQNLLGNAWKYTAKAPAPAIRVYAGEVDSRPGICVADNGAGFDMAHAASLFQPFRRLHRQDEFPGIGIGLATVQRIVHRHGGEIRGVAAPGAGATFCFSLSPLGSNA